MRAPAEFQAAPTTKKVLDNGLTVVVRESHRDPVAELQVWANVGSGDERPGEEGLAHFHEHMLFKGTEQRAVGEVAGDIEGLGGQINAFTSFDSTVYHATLPAAAWRDGLEVLCDAVRRSIFDPEEIEREREVVLEEIRRSEDTPAHVLGDLAFRACYPDHPYGLPILGPAENVAGFDRARVRRFFERWYTPENLTVVAVGDFEAHAVVACVETLFGDAPRGKARRERPTAAAPAGLRVELARRPFEGLRVDLSWPAPRFRDREAVHLDLLAWALGECESSRLVRKVREVSGLVDRIDAGAWTPLDRGLFSVDFETDAERLLAALGAVASEVEALRTAPLTDRELERARRNFLAHEQFERESVSGLAAKLGNFETIGGGFAREAHALAEIERATPEDLLRAARTFLAPEALTATLLLPESAPTELDASAVRAALRTGVQAASGPGGSRPPVAAEAAGATSTSQGIADRVGLESPAVPTRTAPSDRAERFDYRLSNGLALHVLRRPEVPVFAGRIAFWGGLLAESRATSGITRFASALLTRGTEKRSAARFAEDVEDLAAEIDGFSGRNSLGLTVEGLSANLEPAFELFAETLLRPALDESEIENERRETLAALERREDRLAQRAFRLFAETEYEQHPYRLTMGGEPESVAGFEAAGLRAHLGALQRADRGRLAIVGDVDPDQVAALAERTLAALPRGDGPFDLPPEEPRPDGQREAVIRKDRAQAHLVMGFRGLTLDDPDRHALELLSQLLAGQGGRLFLELRDRQSLAYTVAASNLDGVARGTFSIYIATAPEKLEQARRGIREELERLLEQPPPSEELARAIRYGVGGFAIERQRNHARAAQLALDSLYGLGPDHAETLPASLAGISGADVRRVARRVLRLDAATTAIVMP